MKRKLLWLLTPALIIAGFILFQTAAFSQAVKATVILNKEISYQKITGFGGFVNSPQFAYNHMSEDEIRRMWGANS